MRSYILGVGGIGGKDAVARLYIIVLYIHINDRHHIVLERFS